MGLYHPFSIGLIFLPVGLTVICFVVYLVQALRPMSYTWASPPLLPAIYLRIGLGFLFTSFINCAATVWAEAYQFAMISLCMVSGYLLIEMFNCFIWWANLEGGGMNQVGERLRAYQAVEQAPKSLRWIWPCLCRPCGRRIKSGRKAVQHLRLLVGQVLFSKCL